MPNETDPDVQCLTTKLNALAEFMQWMKGGVEKYDDGSVRAAAQDLYDDVALADPRIPRPVEDRMPKNVRASIKEIREELAIAPAIEPGFVVIKYAHVSRLLDQLSDVG